MRSSSLRILVALSILTLSAHSQTVPVAFVDVNVVPMDHEAVLANQTVVVKDGKIAAVGPISSVTIPRDAQRIDGRNRYLMPGLADMHMHFMRPVSNRASDKAARHGSIGSESPNFAEENPALALLFVANLYVLLQKMLNLAVALELLNSNPMQRVPKPKVERTEKPSLSPAQVKAIADNMPQNLKALVVLLYLTGLRIGEALALKWSDVDFDQSKLHVRRSVWRGKEQTPKSRKSVRAKHLLGGLKRTL